MEHFFCYDKDLSIYIHKKGIRSVTTALSPSTLKKFSVFVKSQDLQNAIDEYQKSKIIQ